MEGEKAPPALGRRKQEGREEGLPIKAPSAPPPTGPTGTVRCGRGVWVARCVGGAGGHLRTGRKEGAPEEPWLDGRRSRRRRRRRKRKRKSFSSFMSTRAERERESHAREEGGRRRVPFCPSVRPSCRFHLPLLPPPPPPPPQDGDGFFLSLFLLSFFHALMASGGERRRADQ